MLVNLSIQKLHIKGSLSFPKPSIPIEHIRPPPRLKSVLARAPLNSPLPLPGLINKPPTIPFPTTPQILPNAHFHVVRPLPSVHFPICWQDPLPLFLSIQPLPLIETASNVAVLSKTMWMALSELSLVEVPWYEIVSPWTVHGVVAELAAVFVSRVEC